MSPTLSIGAPHWITQTWRDHNRSRRVRICLVDGLKCDHTGGSVYERTDGTVEIDASIAPLIVELNRRGHETMFCCSGLPEDHDGQPWGADYAYILFAERPTIEAPAGVEVSWDGSHWSFARDPEVARGQWREIAARLEMEWAP